MFSGSVADNLTLFSNHYSASDLQEAIKDASLTDELAKKGSILGQRVEEGGKNFSGGQRQRLELARVLSYNTPLIILDEATSALDTSIELQISLAIKRRKATSVIIAHRLSTIRDADEIIVLSNGSIAERGNHQELIKLGGVYAKMMKLEDKNNDL
jgi:ABC-type multidrug transport system fused ATPase/permease subunit